MKHSILKRSSAAFTLIELLVVIAIIGILAGLLLPVVGRMKTKGKIAQAQMETKNLVAAITQFQSLYGIYPTSEADAKLGQDKTYDTGNSDIVKILLDIDEPGGVNEGHKRNPQKHVFLNGKMTTSPSGPGIGPDYNFRDPWGTPYVITLDLNYDSACTNSVQNRTSPAVQASYGSVRIPVAVWSLGPDRQPFGPSGNPAARDNDDVEAGEVLVSTPLPMKSGLLRTDRSASPRQSGSPAWSAGAVRAAAGFTLLEMLVVLGIIAVILAIALPNLRGLSEGAEMEAAARQLIGDLAVARARAVNHRTTVAIVFIPAEILNLKPAAYPWPESEQIKQLQGGVYTTYALFTSRNVGDQPGRSLPRYLTEWKSLPEKVFIADYKFVAYTDTGIPQFDYAGFPFPLDTSAKSMLLPYVAFDYEGRLCKWDGSPLDVPQNTHIPLAHGAILYGRDNNNQVTGFSVQEVPKDNSILTPNHVVIDWLTGHGRYERTEIQSVP